MRTAQTGDDMVFADGEDSIVMVRFTDVLFSGMLLEQLSTELQHRGSPNIEAVLSFWCDPAEQKGSQNLQG